MLKISKEQKARINSLISKMTLDEKIGQLNLEAPSIVGGFDVPFEELIEMMTDGRISKEEFQKIMSTATQDFHEDDIRKGLVSGLMLTDPHKVNELQKIAVEESRLGIPLMIGFDVIHGLRTVFPIALAEAGTFDIDLMERTAKVAAKESRAHGVNWNFAPMIDVSRDARWGRISEGPGEDPYLASEFAKAKVRGLQGDTSSVNNYVAACLKHYAAYGACEAGRDYNTTSMAISLLHNVYLPSFKAAVEEGAATVMAAFNDLNGIPCTVNEYLLKDVLKKEYGFEGFVVSDANGVKECTIHGIAENNLDAGKKALKAGLDMDMGTQIYKKNMKQLVKEGKVSEALLNEAVERVLTVKMWLGLFDNPYVEENLINNFETIPEDYKKLALESAEKSVVLLKNENHILPLEKNRKISLVGELADKREEVVGAWAMNWKAEDCVSIYEGIKKLSEDITYFPCCGPEGELNMEEMMAAAENSDVIVAVVGEMVSMTGEASSKTDITLPGKQRKMLEYFISQGKTVIAVLMNGRPLALKWEAENLPVIIEGWHLGIEMGTAISKIIYGDVNPEGKLTVTFPSVNGQCPIYYNHPNTGRPGSKSKFTSRYLDAPVEDVYPFGYGLSYTEFKYKNMTIEEKSESIIIGVTITNVGKLKGDETVQVYIQDETASIARPIKELKGFKKISLNPGDKITVYIEVNKNQLGFYNNEAKYELEDGKFNFYIGGNSRDVLKKYLELKFYKNNKVGM